MSMIFKLSKVRCSFFLAISIVFCGWPSSLALAQNQDAGAAEGALSKEQSSVAEKFAKLEELLLRSSELEAKENPTRSALLQQAAQLGKQEQVAQLLRNAAKNLQQEQFSEAIERQKSSKASLEKLLALLQSENREKRVREERDQVRRWIEETNRLLRLQSSLRGRTEGGQDLKQAAKDQEKLSDKAGDISEDLSGDSDSSESESDAGSETEAGETAQTGEQQDPASNQESGNSGENHSPENESDSSDSTQNSESSEAQANGENQAESENAGESSQQDNADQDSGKSAQDSSDNSQSQQQGSQQQGSQQQGSQQQGSQQQGSQQQGNQQQGNQQQGNQQQGNQQQTPAERAQERIERARQKMQEAQEALENAERSGAVEKQRQAEEELREAIEQLEEILRQLREEEIERSLASLETRLRKMLEMQTKILDETTRLQKIAGEGKVSRQVEIRANSLSLDEKKILAEGERAFLLLREEGSSAAFPEAIEQLNVDIADVANRLSKADVGPITVLVEEEIVSSLEEMVQALVAIQKENEEKKQQQQQQNGGPQQGQPGEQPLVDKLAELRLIRTLQLRINKRTDAVSKFLQDPEDKVGQLVEKDATDHLKELSDRQAKIEVVTRDIVVGKGEN